MNVLLTDTLSISKMGNDKYEKERQQLSPEGRLSKIKVKKEHLLTEPARLDHGRSDLGKSDLGRSDHGRSEQTSKLTTLEEMGLVDRDTAKYRKFKQFINSGLSAKKMEKITNSVFYYFPIL